MTRRMNGVFGLRCISQPVPVPSAKPAITSDCRGLVPLHSRPGLCRLRDRLGQGKRNADTSPMPWFLIDLPVAAENLHALLHPQQTEMAATGGSVESSCYVE